MSVVTLGNDAPRIPHDELKALAAKNGLQLREDHVDPFSVLLGAVDQAVETVLAMKEDASLKPDPSRYPRSDIHMPEDTDKGGWATKCTAVAINPASKLLRGMTIALKDNIALAGVRCTNGTDAVEWTPEIDATVATRIMDAGGIITGKAACENSCLEGVSDTSCTGTVHNPYADGYSAGGSSSGCARLVSTGSVDMAVGCDQGGSIRIPASMCGIIGLKPTWGLVPYTGILGLESTIDHAGPMAQSVPQLANLLDVMAGPDGMDDRQPYFMPAQFLNFANQLDIFLAQADPEKPLKGMRLGYLEEGFSLPGMNPDIAALCKSSLDRLATLGAEIVKISVPSHTHGGTVWMCGMAIGGTRQGLLADINGRKQHHMTDRLQAVLASSDSSLLSQETFDKLGPAAQNIWLRYLFLRDKYSPQMIQAKYANMVRKMTTDYERTFKAVDVLCLPTLPSLPCKLFEDPASHTPLERLTRNVGLVGNTSPFNCTGLPALTIPVGLLPHPDDPSVRLPVGLQIVANKFFDSECIKVGAVFQRSFDWKTL